MIPSNEPFVKNATTRFFESTALVRSINFSSSNAFVGAVCASTPKSRRCCVTASGSKRSPIASFSGPIHRPEINLVRLRERAHETGLHRLRSRGVAARFEHRREHRARKPRAKRLQRFRQRRRVMAEILDHRERGVSIKISCRRFTPRKRARASSFNSSDQVSIYVPRRSIGPKRQPPPSRPSRRCARCTFPAATTSLSPQCCAAPRQSELRARRRFR